MRADEQTVPTCEQPVRTWRRQRSPQAVAVFVQGAYRRTGYGSVLARAERFGDTAAPNAPEARYPADAWTAFASWP